MGGGGLNMGDLSTLTEGHRFILLLLIQAASVVSMILLYRSSPKNQSTQANDSPAPQNPPDKNKT